MHAAGFVVPSRTGYGDRTATISTALTVATVRLVPIVSRDGFS